MSKWTILWTCLVCTGFAGVALSGPEDGDPVDFSVEIKAVVTDNRDSSDVDEEGNTDIYVSPRIDVFVDSANTVWDLFYAPSFRYRSDPSDIQNEDELFHRLGIDLDHELSAQTEVRVRERFEVTDDPSVSEGGFTVRDDRSFVRNEIVLGAKHDISELTYADVSVENELKRFDDSDVADESDEDEFGAHVKLWRKVNRTLAAQGQVSWRQYEFESASGIVRDFDVILAAVGVEKAFSPEFRGGLDAGISQVEYDDSGLDSESYPVLVANAEVSPNPDFRINGTVTHGVRDSDVFPFSTQEFLEFRGRVESDPSALVTLRGEVVFRQSEYDEDDLPASAPPALSGDEDTMVASATGIWMLTDTSRLIVRFEVEDVDSDVDVSYTKNTGSVAVLVDI